jgi:hypothetical protein
VAEYGPPESNQTEGIAIALFYLGIMTWVGALAYGASWIQPVLGVLGFAMDAYAVILLARAKRKAAHS